MPSAARLSGMNNVEKIASNADEKPVQSTTSTKISHTWLASHTGPIAHDQLARPPAALASACEQAPQAGPEVRGAEEGVHRGTDPQHACDRVGGAHPEPSATAADGGPEV